MSCNLAQERASVRLHALDGAVADVVRGHMHLELVQLLLHLSEESLVFAGHLLTPDDLLLVDLLVDQRDLVGVQVDLIFDLQDLLVQRSEVDGLTQDVPQDHLGLVHLEDGRERCHILLDVDIQVAFLV